MLVLVGLRGLVATLLDSDVTELVGLRRLVATLLVFDEMIRAVERDHGGLVVDH